MKIAVSGASGLIGGALLPALRADGHEVLTLVRRTPRTVDEHRWDPQHRRIDPGLLADVDAVINLGGTPIRPRPFTAGYKERLLRSRIDATTTISEALAAAAAADPGRPRVLLSASAVGYYGDTGSRTVTEQDPAGEDFLAQVCAQWEAATAPAEAAGVRVVRLRTGLVLDRQGDADADPGPGLPARPGRAHGQRAAVLAVDQPDRRHRGGPPPPGHRRLGPGQPHRPGTGHQRRVHPRARPSGAPAGGAPRAGFAINLALGEFGRSSVTAGQRALPARLEESGYRFAHPDFVSALRAATSG